MNNTTNIVILKSVSGAGKSTVANTFQGPLAIACADDYFINEDGDYVFNASKLGEAHKFCRERFDYALNSGYYKTVVVANTNCSERDWKYYADRGEELGCKVFHLVVENHHGNKNIHGVPEETLQNQERKLRASLKLR